MAPEAEIYVNGINGETGKYMIAPMTYEQVIPFITGEKKNKKMVKWLRRIWKSFKSFHMGDDYDWANLAEAGWGVVFRQGESEAVKAAIEPLYQHRREGVGNDERIKRMEYLPDESWEAFLGRYGIGPGKKDPRKVPFYLLLVGGPEKIPFSFGYKLDIEYAVGRLDFDSPAGYSAYVSSVIDYEKNSSVPNSRTAVFFGTRHELDPPTKLSADRLVTPLADGLPGMPGIAQQLGFQSKKLVEQAAKRAELTQVFAPAAGVKPPAFLFTASHGMVWPFSKPAEQRARQGALLCQDWPGFGKISPDNYFAASDLPAEARLQGMITFHFACYSAGTPLDDRYLHKARTKPPQIAAAPFIAALPKALLSHPKGSALAVIGHVERAWDTSIATTEAGDQIGPFQSAIGYILHGEPVGFAVKDINMRYATYSVNIADLLEQLSFGKDIPDQELATAWIKRNDAEGYIIIGDPAVRLRVKDLI
ncbi:MAG: hypothetical protein MUC85_05620 [Anaerolineales bacterium]|jgi:hypothetical protein|nr:hypothetical protein [Anaerolineales bacterium]